MNMKLLVAWMLLLSVAFAQDEKSAQIQEAYKEALFKKSYELFISGRYNATLDELNIVERTLDQDHKSSKAQKGLVAYWKGITYNRTQDFFKAIESFDKSLSLNFDPIDINYEYGQALFAAQKLQEARLQFRESLKKRFKRAISLYYIAYISKEVGDKKKAVTFYQAIQKLPAEEIKEVAQASEMQIGDIYLEQAEKHPDSFRAVESYVLPQYKKALQSDQDSELAQIIEKKIVDLQKKYDLILLRMRNGRPTLNPPYFLRLAQEISNDSNVTFTPEETTTASSDKSSLYSKTDVMGRYTFYVRNMISIAPELRMNYTYYAKRTSDIYRNDNYLIAPAVRMYYEHTLFKKPASTLLDFEHSYVERDIDAQKKLKYASRSNGVMIGERFNYFDAGESILRFKYRKFESYNANSNSNTKSFVYEQVKSFKQNLLLFYSSYDMTRVDDESFDTNGLTLRGDLIFAPYKNWFTPSVGFGLTLTDPINNKDGRGMEKLYNPSLRLARLFGKRMRGSFKVDYSKNDSKDKANFAYTKTIYGFELEYLF
jgi:hypothetical protein